MIKSNKSWSAVAILAFAVASILIGCSNPDGEGLTDQQKLDGAAKARSQQMGNQREGQGSSNAPLTRDSLPGQNNGK